MLVLGPLGFAAPWVLVALAGLPLLWLILRALPPRPRMVPFAGTGLLDGIRDPYPLARHTPWWLLLLRLLALGALIIGFADPVWKPAPGVAPDRALVVVVDAGWAAAPEWSARVTAATREIARSGAAGHPVALLVADGRNDGELPFAPASDQAARLRAAQPVAWGSRYPADPQAALAGAPPAGVHTIWFSDGLDHPGREALLQALAARGPVRVLPPAGPVQSLELISDEQPALIYRSLAAPASAVPPDPVIRAIGPDPQGVQRELARLTPAAPQVRDGTVTRPVPIELPSELRNRITRFEIEGTASAGAVVLADDRVRRRKVALIGQDRMTEGQELLSPLHYLREAIAPGNDLIAGSLDDVLQAGPDVIVMVDQLLTDDSPRLEEWIHEGGLLIRFSGPRMAADPRLGDDPLLPVRLRQGGRDVGGALGWGEPRTIARFDGSGPFAGLTAPDDVAIRAQLLPQPAPDLDVVTIARLSDQTPLVTREMLGEGQLVLFHTTANAEWGNLPLSGLFVQMLDRLIQGARRTESVRPADDPAAPLFWNAQYLLDGFGRRRDLSDAGADLAPVSAADFAQGPGPVAPAGVYMSGERQIALNAGGALRQPRWPGAEVGQIGAAAGIGLRKWLILLAAALFALDGLGSGLLMGGGRRVMT